MSVVGIGGVFFRAADPETLQAWYREHLGIVIDYASPWVQQPGPTLFMPFPRDTDHFPAAKQWMINFRVADLDRLLASLREAGGVVTTTPSGTRPRLVSSRVSRIPKAIPSSCGSRLNRGRLPTARRGRGRRRAWRP
ncbi:MAG TPA: VOC family protein [Caulobacteraceae bacterium]